MTEDNARFADAAGRYRLGSRIATGGMGEVWRATDTVLGRPVAVKVLKGEYADDATFRARFETEARHAAALHHPGIAAVFDFGQGPASDGGSQRPFLVMELVEGQPLSNLLRPGAAMDPEAARDLLAQAATALGVAHRAGIVHRDVKPPNLLVTPDRRVKITDFGIARAAEAMALTQTGQVMGTPAYLSPEQAEGRTATAASDVYSLGVVLFECLAGRRPFAADTAVATALAHLREPVPALPANVPADLAAVVTRALAKDPSQRFADGDAMAAALRGRVVPPAPDPAAAPAPAPSATRVLPHSELPPAPVERRSGRGWWWALAALLLLGLLAWWLVGALGDSTDPSDAGQEPTASAEADPATDEPSDSATPEPTDGQTEPTEATEAVEPTDEPSEEPTEEPMVDVVADDYLGDDANDAKDALKDLGFKVRTEKIDNPDGAEEGTVAGVSPTGPQPEGTEITLTVWKAATGPNENEPDQPAESAELPGTTTGLNGKGTLG